MFESKMFDYSLFDPLRLAKLYGVYLVIVALLLMGLFLIPEPLPTSLGNIHPLSMPVAVSLYFAYVAAYNLSVFSGLYVGGNSYLSFLALDITLFCLIVINLNLEQFGLSTHLLMPVVIANVLYPGNRGFFVAAWLTCSLFLLNAFVQDADSNAFFRIGIIGGVAFLLAFFVQLVAKPLATQMDAYQDQNQKLRRLQLLNNQILQRINVGAVVAKQDGTVITYNHAAKQLLEIKGNMEFLPLPILNQFNHWKISPHLPIKSIQLTQTSPNINLTFKLLESENQSELLVFLENEAELRNQAQQLKTDHLAKLTASIAHEIRNPLSAVSHAAQLIQEVDYLDSEDKELTDIIVNQCDRIDSIIGKLETLGRPKKSEVETIDIVKFCQDFIDERKSDFKDNIETEVRAIRAEMIGFDPIQLHQILSNFWENSIKHSGSEKLKVKFIIDRDPLLQQPYLDFCDNGKGISDNILDSVFDPFFTTAHNGKGLGLYISKSLCEYNHARLSVSPSQSGACFRIMFSKPYSNLEAAVS